MVRHIGTGVAPNGREMRLRVVTEMYGREKESTEVEEKWDIVLRTASIACT